MFTLPADLPAAAALRLLGESGQTRAPVVGPTGLDDVVGIVHMRDLLDGSGVVADHAHPPLFMPETLRVTDAIRQMRQLRQLWGVPIAVVAALTGTDSVFTSQGMFFSGTAVVTFGGGARRVADDLGHLRAVFPVHLPRRAVRGTAAR